MYPRSHLQQSKNSQAAMRIVDLAWRHRARNDEVIVILIKSSVYCIFRPAYRSSCWTFLSSCVSSCEPNSNIPLFEIEWGMLVQESFSTAWWKLLAQLLTTTTITTTLILRPHSSPTSYLWWWDHLKFFSSSLYGALRIPFQNCLAL